MVTNLTENFLTALLEFLDNSDFSIRVFRSFIEAEQKGRSNASKEHFGA